MIYDSYDDMRYACIRFARFSKILRNTGLNGRFLSVDPSKSSPPNLSIYNSVHVAIRTQIPHKQ